MRSGDSVDLVQEPPRYPLGMQPAGSVVVALLTPQRAVCCEPSLFYLPAVLAVAWLHGLRAGLIAAVGAAAVASVAEFATSITAPGASASCRGIS